MSTEKDSMLRVRLTQRQSDDWMPSLMNCKRKCRKQVLPHQA